MPIQTKETKETTMQNPQRWVRLSDDPDTSTRSTSRRWITRLATVAITLAVITATQLTLSAGPANAGTVGVSGRIQGAGSIFSVEGGPYSCSRTGNQDDRVTVNCHRLPFEAGLEAWVWLRAIPADWPTGAWSFSGWSGCDATRVVSGVTECAVHSGAFTGDERFPKAHFLSRNVAKSIVAQHSGKCLDVAYASTAHAADVVQGTCWGGANQRWTTRPLGGGYYQIVAKHSGKCLDVAWASKAHAANVIQGTCGSGTNQQWRFQYSSATGHFQVIARHSGKCLDVAYASTAHAADVIQGNCSGGANQNWRFQ